MDSVADIPDGQRTLDDETVYELFRLPPEPDSNVVPIRPRIAEPSQHPSLRVAKLAWVNPESLGAARKLIGGEDR